MHRFSQGGAVLFVLTNEVEDEGTFVLQGVCTVAVQGTYTRVPLQNHVKIRTASAETSQPIQI